MPLGKVTKPAALAPVKSVSTPTVTVLVVPPADPGLLEALVPLEAAPVVVAEEPDLEELLHPATKTRAAANTTGILHLLRTIFTTPLVDFPI